jgi:hypothetical protein
MDVGGRTMTPSRFPPGWDEERLQTILPHYEEQTEEEETT